MKQNPTDLEEEIDNFINYKIIVGDFRTLYSVVEWAENQQGNGELKQHFSCSFFSAD